MDKGSPSPRPSPHCTGLWVTSGIRWKEGPPSPLPSPPRRGRIFGSALTIPRPHSLFAALWVTQSRVQWALSPEERVNRGWPWCYLEVDSRFVQISMPLRIARSGGGLRERRLALTLASPPRRGETADACRNIERAKSKHTRLAQGREAVEIETAQSHRGALFTGLLRLRIVMRQVLHHLSGVAVRKLHNLGWSTCRARRVSLSIFAKCRTSKGAKLANSLSFT